MAKSANTDWLTLTEASDFLGVHPITLRSWADAGLVRAFRTPGRHRRFRRAELLAFMEQQRTQPQSHALVPAPDQTLQRVRHEIDASPLHQAAWYARLSNEQRALHREIGQRLLGLLLQFVSRQENAHHFLYEAQSLARRYGIEFAQAKLTASELAQAFLFFRRMVIHATYHPEGTHAQADADGVRLLQRINTFMDELLIATLNAYDEEMMSRAAEATAPASPARLTRKSGSAPARRRFKLSRTTRQRRR